MNAADRITLDVHDDPPAADAAVVDDGLGDFNEGAAPLDGVHRLACFARLDGEVVGGAVGRTWGICCELQQLWVDERFRRQGLGAKLVERFEAQADSRGCTRFHLETFSFQAPAFYERLGYRSVASIAGFPDGIVKFLMVRDASAGASAEGSSR